MATAENHEDIKTPKISVHNTESNLALLDRTLTITLLRHGFTLNNNYLDDTITCCDPDQYISQFFSSLSSEKSNFIPQKLKFLGVPPTCTCQKKHESKISREGKNISKAIKEPAYIKFKTNKIINKYIDEINTETYKDYQTVDKLISVDCQICQPNMKENIKSKKKLDQKFPAGSKFNFADNYLPYNTENISDLDRTTTLDTIRSTNSLSGNFSKIPSFSENAFNFKKCKNNVNVKLEPLRIYTGFGKQDSVMRDYVYKGRDKLSTFSYNPDMKSPILLGANKVSLRQNPEILHSPILSFTHHKSADASKMIISHNSDNTRLINNYFIIKGYPQQSQINQVTERQNNSENLSKETSVLSKKRIANLPKDPANQNISHLAVTGIKCLQESTKK